MIIVKEQECQLLNFLKKNFFLIGIILILLPLSIFIWFFGTNLTLGYTDTAYHLAVAQGFARAGGITLWDFWESLPLGRPHLYPPLFHMVLASLLKIRLSPTLSIKLIMETSIIGGMVIYAWGLNKLFNIKTAFWAVFLLALSTDFIRLSVTVMPAAIILFLVPALFHFLLSRKWIAYIALLAIIFYLHMFMPYVIILTILLYLIIFDRKVLFKAILVSLAAFILYLPWLAHIFASGLDYIKYFDSNYSLDRWRGFSDINIMILTLLVAGWIYGIRFAKAPAKQSFYFFIIFFLAVSSLSFFTTSRTINGHLLVPAAAIGGFFLANQKFQKWKSYTLFPLIAFLLLFIPYFHYQSKDFRFFLGKTSFYNLFNPSDYLIKEPREKLYKPLISSLNKTENSGQSLVSLMNNFDGLQVEQNYQGHIANYFEGNTNLSTLNLYDPEVYHRPMPDLLKANYLLISLPISEIDPAYLAYFGYGSLALPEQIRQQFSVVSLVRIDENNTYYLLKNRQTKNTISEQIPLFHVPLLLANVIILILISAIIIDNRRRTCLR